MNNETYLFANASITAKGHQLISQSAFEQCTTYSLEEMIQFIKQTGYDLSGYHFHQIKAIDQWKQDEDHKLEALYQQFGCADLLDIYAIEKQPESLFQMIQRAHTYGITFGGAAQVFARIFIDEIIAMSLLRQREVSQECLNTSWGNVTVDGWTNILLEKQTIEAVLSDFYPHEFSTMVTHESLEDRIIVCQQGFRLALSNQLSVYRHSMIGVDGLVAYLYAKKSELYNCRMLLKAKHYYLSEKTQLSLLRRMYG